MGSHALYSLFFFFFFFFFCFIHFIIQNEFVIKKRNESSFAVPGARRSITGMVEQAPFVVSHTEPELQTTKGRDSAMMYISNKAYLSTT